MAWLRLYDDILADPKVLLLGPELFQTWVFYLAAYKKYDGNMPDRQQIACLLRLTEEKLDDHLSRLVKARLCDVDGEIIRPHNWDKFQYKSDVSSERVKRFRNAETPLRKRQQAVTETANDRYRNGQMALLKRDCAVTETAPETDTDTETETEKKRGPSFDLEAAFEEVWEAYPAKGRTRKPMSQQYYVESVATLPDDQQAAMHARIMAPLRPGGKWTTSAQWAKGFIQGLSVYLNQKQWLESPEPAVRDSYTLDLREPEDDTPIVRGELPVFSDEEFAADIARMHSK